MDGRADAEIDSADFVLNLEPYIGSLPDFCPTTLPSLNNWLKDVMGLICMNLYWVVTVEDRDLSKRNITPHDWWRPSSRDTRSLWEPR